MRQSRRIITNLILGVISGLAILYSVLLIPCPEQPPVPSGEKEPFIWDQDRYWSELEAMFIAAKAGDSVSVFSDINEHFSNTESLLDSCKASSLDPSSPALSRLEVSFFELSALVAARPIFLPELMRFQAELRGAIKEQSKSWNMNSGATRNRLYRLLYGTRTAVEEVILQADRISIPGLIRGTDEQSATPAAEILGVKIHSGDILVSRGGAPTSALIARGNDYPGNFSHVALAYVDEKSGEVSIVESHIECGVAIASIEDYLKDTKLRVMVLRLRSDLPFIEDDPMLPHTAASNALSRALTEHVPYDFEMDFQDSRKLFCSEVASSAYSDLNVELWMGISNISSTGVRSWLAAFGVKNFETQEPSDLEYDPQLVVVAEWRDPVTLYKDHLDNAVIDVMLEAAESGEKLDYDLYMLPMARVLKGYSFIRNLFGEVGPIPEGMSAAAALKNDRFSKRHNAIKEELIKSADSFSAERGYRPPYWELVNLARQSKEELESH